MTSNDAMTNSGISPAEVATFQENGFLLVEDFFSHEELDRYGKAVDAAVAHRTADDHRSLADKNLYEQTFVQCMRLWEDHPDVSPFTFHPKLCAAAAALLKTDCVRLWHDQALYKEPGGRKTDAHLDYPFWPVDKPDLVSVWIPFQDVGPGDGMMSYVQGSHKAGITDFVDIGQLRGGQPYDILQDEKVASLPLVPVAAKKGSAIFHHACTIHCADANETGSTRRVFTMVYLADGLRRSRDDAYFALDRDNIATGELVVGPGHPVAWPRDDDALPQPPAELGPKTGFGFSESDEPE
jgi:ectoine hydroxylase-related dioxygenase (phytanoyl-CoA dioxygenase family)